jgi:hypothetical protein
MCWMVVMLQGNGSIGNNNYNRRGRGRGSGRGIGVSNACLQITFSGLCSILRSLGLSLIFPVFPPL